jgi:hypothetical protein
VIFRAIPTFDGYEVSDAGVVRSYRKQRGGRRVTPVVIGGALDEAGYPFVHLMQDGRCVTRRTHVLLLLAFVGPRPEGADIRHLNGDSTDCRLENLAYGSRSENALDRERHTPRTHCKRGHQFDEINTYWTPSGDRECRPCRKAARDRYRARRRAA